MRINWKILSLVALTVSLCCCAFFGEPDEQTPPPSTPIFSDVVKIELQSPTNGSGPLASSTSFQFVIPEDVEYVVLALFSAPIQVSGKTILNPSAWQAGSRTGLAGSVTE